MSSIVPNRSLVEGRIISVHKSADIDNFSVMEIQPSRISPVEGSVTLLRSGDGSSSSGEQPHLHIHVSNEVSQQHDLSPGKMISAQVRKAPDNLFVIPDSVKVM
ncbi:MAG TPA: hypothetical protein VHD83_19835 [Puia sp.]|nr:hypothetical protein [Puia sp.]